MRLSSSILLLLSPHSSSSSSLDESSSSLDNIMINIRLGCQREDLRILDSTSAISEKIEHLKISSYSGICSSGSCFIISLTFTYSHIYIEGEQSKWYNPPPVHRCRCWWHQQAGGCPRCKRSHRPEDPRSHKCLWWPHSSTVSRVSHPNVAPFNQFSLILMSNCSDMYSRLTSRLSLKAASISFFPATGIKV